MYSHHLSWSELSISCSRAERRMLKTETNALFWIAQKDEKEKRKEGGRGEGREERTVEGREEGREEGRRKKEKGGREGGKWARVQITFSSSSYDPSIHSRDGFWIVTVRSASAPDAGNTATTQNDGRSAVALWSHPRQLLSPQQNQEPLHQCPVLLARLCTPAAAQGHSGSFVPSLISLCRGTLICGSSAVWSSARNLGLGPCLVCVY